MVYGFFGIVLLRAVVAKFTGTLGFGDKRGVRLELVDREFGKSDHGPSVATTVSGSNGTCLACRLSYRR